MKKIISLALALMMILALVSCGLKDTKKDDETDKETKTEVVAETKEIEDTEETDAPESNDDSENPFLNMDFYEDDEKVTWKLTDQVAYVFYHDGKNVTRFIVYTDYGTEEEAEDMMNLLKMSYDKVEDSPIKDLFREGSFVGLEYTEDEFMYHTYDELQQQIEYFKMLMTVEVE